MHDMKTSEKLTTLNQGRRKMIAAIPLPLPTVPTVEEGKALPLSGRNCLLPWLLLPARTQEGHIANWKRTVSDRIADVVMSSM
jgi:hypothetical protein